jgi:hypothetical protein
MKRKEKAHTSLEKCNQNKVECNLDNKEKLFERSKEKPHAEMDPYKGSL